MHMFKSYPIDTKNILHMYKLYVYTTTQVKYTDRLMRNIRVTLQAFFQSDSHSNLKLIAGFTFSIIDQICI